MRKYSFNTIKVTLLFVLAIGCSKKILDENPPNVISSPGLYKNLAGFEAGLNGLYSLARTARGQSEKLENVLNGVDNMASNYGRSQIFFNWGSTNSPADRDLKETFEWLYQTINAANTIINRAENKEIDWIGGRLNAEGNKNRVVAEARAIRGWAYRRLTYSWGDVPLSLEEAVGSSIKTDWVRAPVENVRRQVIADYTFAQQYVPVEGSLQGRLTKGAVQTYLAEMYLTIDKPDSALYWADQVINTPAYKLVTARYGVKKSEPGIPFMDMFLEGNQNREQGNTEALWVIQFELNTIGGSGNQMSRSMTGNYNQITINGKRYIQFTYDRGGRGKSYFAPTKWWIDSYEPEDERASNFAIRKFFILRDASSTSPTGNAPYPADVLPSAAYKYGDTIKLAWATDLSRTYKERPDWPYSRKGEGTDPNNMLADFSWADQVYLRLADTYLLKAEAQFKLGNSAGAAATINIIRARSKATPVTAANINIDFILDERSRELFLEEERRFTLLRTHRWFERTQLYNHYGGELVARKDTLFPIPQSVIDANLTSAMRQNPGF